MIRVRPMTAADLEGVRDVGVRNGLSSFDPADVIRSWESHPFRTEFEGIPHGWVLATDEGQIVGTFSNVHMLYELGGKPVKAGIAGSWAVDPAHRNSSMLLALSYFNQQGVDVCLNGSASAVASRLMEVMKARRIPSPEYDLSYFWITNATNFAEAALRKKGVPGARQLAHLAAAGLWLDGLRAPRPGKPAAGARRLTAFGPEFDRFWARLREGANRLRAVRTAAALDWRFGQGLRQKRVTVVGLLHREELQGYVVLREVLRRNLNLRQYVIADLQAEDDSADVLTELLQAALSVTREDKLDALEWQGWNKSKRAVAVRLQPKTYRYGVWPLYFKVRNAQLTSKMEDAGCWDFSPFDAF